MLLRRTIVGTERSIHTKTYVVIFLSTILGPVLISAFLGSINTSIFVADVVLSLCFLSVDPSADAFYDRVSTVGLKLFLNDGIP